MTVSLGLADFDWLARPFRFADKIKLPSVQFTLAILWDSPELIFDMIICRCMYVSTCASVRNTEITF